MVELNFKNFVTVSKAAQQLGVSKATIRIWADTKMIPVYRHPLNNYRLFKNEELREVLWKIQQEKKQ